jgi:eukaryotic-like serine/threonine-protein kinase
VPREVPTPGRTDLHADELVGGRYRLERSLGNGGMGEVFAATDTLLDRRVALKRLSPAMADDEPAKARFLREARALARINAPNVVAVFDAGSDGDPYLVMELIEGTTLRAELRKSGRLPPERAAAVAARVASGLAAAHAQGVIHRDVKPSNIFLSTDGEPKVGDFGIARIERGDKTLTLTGQTFGSPAYMSPEQAMGERVDARTDLYALGCVLYEMLAGRRPFQGDDAVSLTYQHLHTRPVRLDEIDARIAPELASLVDGLLQKEPADRPGSAVEVQRALAAGPSTPPPVEADDTVVLARRVETLSRRRRPWWLIGAGAAGLLVFMVMLANALRNGGEQASGAISSAIARSPSAEASSPATTSVSPTPTIPSTPEAAGAALVALASDLAARYPMEKHLADDIEHTVDDVLEHADEPGEAFERLDELKGKIADEMEKGKITSSDAALLTRAIDRLERSLSSGGESD